MMDQLEKDDFLRKRAERKLLSLESQKEEVCIIKDLADVGCHVNSVWDLVNSNRDYSEAIPVLLSHIKKPYMDMTREGIGRALAVPSAAHAWEDLLPMFDDDPDTKTNGAKWALGVALSVYARKRGLYNEAMSILRNKKHGKNRLPFLDVFAKSRTDAIRKCIIEFADDPDLKIQVSECFKKWKKAEKRKNKA